MKYLFLILIFFSLSDAKIFRDNPEIVVDDSARLMWNDDISVIKVMKEHEDAEAYCSSLNHAGYNNWRLPKIEEYELIVDKKIQKTI